MKTRKISQICCVSLDLKQCVFNRYVYYKPLAPDWQELIDKKIVTLSAWNDRKRSAPLGQVLLELAPILLEDSIVLFKGNTDLSSLRTSINELENKDQVYKAFGQTRFLSVDKVWHSLVTKETQEAVMNGKRVRTLSAVYDNLFWKSVFVDANGDLPALDLKLAPAVVTPILVDKGEPFDVEFLQTEHMQPIWHTAHTDTLCMRNITCFLMHLKQESNLLPKEFSEDTLGILSTLVAIKTNYFRDAHLAAEYTFSTKGGEYLLAGSSSSSSPIKAEEEKEEEPKPRTGKVRIVDGSYVKVHTPTHQTIKRHFGVVKTEPLDEPELTAPSKWFYYPDAAGKQIPGFQILHHESCARKGKIAYLGDDVRGLALIFDKECTGYDESGPLDINVFEMPGLFHSPFKAIAAEIAKVADFPHFSQVSLSGKASVVVGSLALFRLNQNAFTKSMPPIEDNAVLLLCGPESRVTRASEKAKEDVWYWAKNKTEIGRKFKYLYILEWSQGKYYFPKDTRNNIAAMEMGLWLLKKV